MNWLKVTQSLHKRAHELLTEAQTSARNGEIHATQSNLTVAGVLIALADALRQGAHEEDRHPRGDAESAGYP